MNVIPPGLNNNLAWQIGHLCVSTEALFYRAGAVHPERSIPGVKQYMRGTKPEAFIPAEEIATQKTRLLSVIDEIEKDYQPHSASQPLAAPFVNPTIGMTFATLDEILWFTTHHDMMHWGNMLALKKLV